MRADVSQWSSFDTALATVSMLIEEYQARLLEYHSDPGGEITFSMRLPEDPWQRRVIGHRVRFRRNQIFADRVRTHLTDSRALSSRVRAFVDGYLAAA